MQKIYPYFPQPVETKVSQFMTFFKKGRSWLNGLYAKSYTMHMGEVKMPGVTLYIPNEPELIQRVLISEAKLFPKNKLLHEILEPLLGDSIFTTNGKIWRKQRELLNPSFDMIKISQVFDLMNNSAKDMAIRLESLSNGEYNNIDEEMTFVTADIIFRTILSKKLDVKKGIEIVNAFIVFQELSAKNAMGKLFFVPKIFTLKSERVRFKSGEKIRDYLSSIIEPRYKDKNNKNKDILSSLLKVIDEDTGEPFSFKEILDQIAMLFLAGHETTASSMTWTLYLLALYPNYQEEAYQEVISICKDDEFTVENTKNLKFVMNIFQESLRLYPPVSFFARESLEECAMRDKKLKAGSAVVISPWLMHRNERYWKDPHMFNPHRFDNPKDIIKNTYFPFGLGQRICIGAKFALQEVPLLLATILREYKLELKPNFTPDVVGRLTTRSLNGMPIKLIKRKQ